VVLQDPYLFDDTIAYNLRCARPDATDAQVREVLEKAQALPFVEQFPDKLDHRCGEGGSQLSGGQKQRIAMARCMILGSKFVILDEPTSALDTESELLVQRAMDNLFSDRTVFIIAHRLSTIRRVDRILVIDEGRIVEDGNYDNLIEKRGLFWRLHSLSNAEPEALEPSEVNRSG